MAFVQTAHDKLARVYRHGDLFEKRQYRAHASNRSAALQPALRDAHASPAAIRSVRWRLATRCHVEASFWLRAAGCVATDTSRGSERSRTRSAVEIGTSAGGRRRGRKVGFGGAP
jgi:hypothetical protein